MVVSGDGTGIDVLLVAVCITARVRGAVVVVVVVESAGTVFSGVVDDAIIQLLLHGSAVNIRSLIFLLLREDGRDFSESLGDRCRSGGPVVVFCCFLNDASGRHRIAVPRRYLPLETTYQRRECSLSSRYDDESFPFSNELRVMVER